MYVIVRSVGEGRVMCGCVIECPRDGEGVCFCTLFLFLPNTFYYYSKKGKVKRRLIRECRCDERLKAMFIMNR